MILSKRKNAIRLIRKHVNIMRCPLCGSCFHMHENGSIKCEKAHTFDISSKGYINFINHKVIGINYDKQLFISRREVFNSGYYDEVCHTINENIKQLIHAKSKINILDVGCGEGFYTYKMSSDTDLSCKSNFFAVDISKEAVKLATNYPTEALWCVADLVKLPFKSESIDILLDVLTPANYTSFNRVLKRDGYIIKVVPGKDYLKEIRSQLSSELKNKSYDNEEIVSYACKNMDMIKIETIYYRYPINPEITGHLFTMTPLAYGKVDDLSDFGSAHITIHLEILVGQKLM